MLARFVDYPPSKPISEPQHDIMKSPKELTTIANILGGVPILGVLPGSPAERAGLQYGDIVLRVNGVQTETFVEFLKAHESGREGLELDVFRNGAHVSVVLSPGAAWHGRDELRKPAAARWAPALPQAKPVHKLS